MGLRREEIVRTTGIEDSGNLTRKLEDLESCDFIRSYIYFGKKKRDAVYQLIDNFTLFHFRFLAKRPTDERYLSNQVNTPSRNAWCGLAFERVCLQHAAQIKSRLGISGVLTEVHSWYCRADADKGLFGSQANLLIVRRDQVINVCELKYASADYTFTKKDDEAMRNRISDIQAATGTRCAIHPMLVTTYGMRKSQYWGTVQAVIVADDLFKPLD